MYGPPTLPATGGGLALLGLAAYGGYIGNWIVIGISFGLMVVIGVAMYRLRIGEKKIAARDSKKK